MKKKRLFMIIIRGSGWLKRQENEVKQKNQVIWKQRTSHES